MDEKKWIHRTTDGKYWQYEDRRWWLRTLTPATEEEALAHGLIVPVNAPTREEIETTATCATTDERYWQTPDGKWWWEEYDDEMTEVTQETVDSHTDGHNGVGIMVFKTEE